MCFVFSCRITLEIMTLQPRCEDVETAEGVAITVTGVAQVRPHVYPVYTHTHTRTRPHLTSSVITLCLKLKYLYSCRISITCTLLGLHVESLVWPHCVFFRWKSWRSTTYWQWLVSNFWVNQLWKSKLWFCRLWRDICGPFWVWTFISF